NFLMCVGEERLQNEIDRCSCTFNVQEYGCDLRSAVTAHDLLCRKPRGNIARAEAHRLVALIHAAVCVVRRPAGHILEETDCADAAVATEVEPVQGALWHANQIA